MTIGRISYPAILPMQNTQPNMYAPATKNKEQESIFMSTNGQKVTKQVAFGEYEKSIAAQNALVQRHEEAHRIASGPQAAGSPIYESKSDKDGRLIITGGHQNVTIPKAVDKASPLEQINQTLTAARFAEKGALAPQSFDELSDADKQVAQQSRQIISSAQTAQAERLLLQQQQGLDPNQKTDPNKLAQAKSQNGQTGQKLNLIG